MSVVLVRLHPYLPKQGYVMRSFTLVNHNLRFVQDRGWYRLDDPSPALLRELEDKSQQDRYPDGPRAFLVAKGASFDEAKAEAKRLEDIVDARMRKAVGINETVGTIDAPAVPARPGTRPGARETSARERSTVAVRDDGSESESEGSESESSDTRPRRRRR
jgi:hypothetical protein